MDLPSSSAETLDVDVVIMGGGIQGLWLLAELVDAGYQAILLERMQPGFGQTGDIDMGDAGELAFGCADGPAHGLDTIEPFRTGNLKHLIEVEIGQDGGDESEFHGITFSFGR